MPRPKKANGEATESPLAAATTEGAEEPRISVRMEGTAEAVKKQLGVASEAKPEEKKPEVIEDAEKFFALLKNPKLIIKVKRLRPKMWKGKRTGVEVWSNELPLQWEEIKQEVADTAKGGTYKVSVVDPNTGQVVDARNFEVEGEPELGEPSPEERAIFEIGNEPEKDAAQITEEGLERSSRIAAKQLEYQRIQNQLKELRGDTAQPGKHRSSEADARIDELERRLIEAKHAADLENQQRRHEAEMKELRAMLQQNQAKPAQSEIALLIQQMQKNQELAAQQAREDRQAADRRFDAMQKQMHDDKQNQMLEELRAIRNKPQQQQGGMLEMAETMLKLRKVFGWGGDDDDDDGDEKDDDRPWWERALDQLGKRLGPKVIDRIFDKLDGLENSGKKVDRDAFIKTVEDEKKKEDEFVRLATEEALKRLPAPKDPVTVPAKEAETKPPQDVPVVNVMERKIVSGGPPAPAPATQASPAPAPAAEPKADPDVLAKITCQKVAELVVAIEQEFALRPRQYEWNYEFAWSQLPEAILEKVCQAKNPAELFDSFKVEGIDVKLLEEMKQKVLSDQRGCTWLQRGITELNRWWAKSQKNPNFDPADEDDEAPEEEGTGL